MGWDQLVEICREARERRAAEDAEPPVACPLDGEVLMIHPTTGERRCPSGDGYSWMG